MAAALNSGNRDSASLNFRSRSRFSGVNSFAAAGAHWQFFREIKAGVSGQVAEALDFPPAGRQGRADVFRRIIMDRQPLPRQRLRAQFAEPLLAHVADVFAVQPA